MIHLDAVKFFNALGAISANGAYTCNVIDTKGFDRCTIVCNLGLVGAGTFTALKVREDDTKSSATALTSPADISGTVIGTDTDLAGSATTLPGDSDDGTLIVFDIDLKVRKRYLLLAATSGAATLLSATAILSRAEQAPVTATQKGARTVMRV